MSALLLSAALVLSAPAAHADWDWEDEQISRHWRTASLLWASEIHPSNPTTAWIDANVAPPPKELWCDEPPPPSPQDLDKFDDLLKDWIVDYLDLGPNDPIPENPVFPYEC